jgi:hypothetical protein
LSPDKKSGKNHSLHASERGGEADTATEACCEDKKG